MTAAACCRSRHAATYNGKGRPSQIAGTSANTFAYDANDYRIKKVDSAGTRQYHLEAEHLEATYNQSGQLVDKYLRGAVIDEIVNGYHYPTPGSTNGWKNYTFHHDQSNSVTATSAPNGGVEDQTGFDPFGMITSSTQPGSGNTLLYTGREYDRDAGLYYYRARYYDPEIGRFISEDPKGFGAGINFYAYCSSNPINCNDPTGLADNTGYWKLGWEWLSGTGPRHHDFDGGDPATQILMQHDHIQDVRSVIATGSTSGTNNYSLSGLQGIPEFISDYSSVLTNGNTGNLAAAYLGSYALNYKVTSVNSNGAATVNFNVSNASTIESATHPPVIGYMSWWNEYVGQPLNNLFSSGPLSKTTQSFNWTETIQLNPSVKPNTQSSIFNFSNPAAGGYVIYPNKPNTNMAKQVYAK